MASIRYRQGFRPAGYFMTGWIMVTLSSTVWSFAVYLPAAVPTQYILQLGFVAEVIFIALAFVKEVEQIVADREKINKEYVESNGKNIPMSVSIGVTEYVNGDIYEGLIHRGDKALYKAKELGKNVTVME